MMSLKTLLTYPTGITPEGALFSCLELSSPFIQSPLFAARARQGLLPGLQPDGAGVGRQAEPGDVAGRVAVRAPGPGGVEKSASDGERGAQRPRRPRQWERRNSARPGQSQDASVAQLARGPLHEQLASQAGTQ